MPKALMLEGDLLGDVIRLEKHKVRIKQTAGHIFEVKRYSRGFWTGFKSSGGRRKGVQGVDVAKNRKDTSRRRFQAVIDTANCNFDTEYCKFLTLTYAENVTDLDRAQRDLNLFLTKLRQRYGKVGYLWVVEFQQRGAIHYHILLDIKPKIPMGWLTKAWNHGFVKINAIKHVDNIGAYIAKYMCKLDDDRLNGRRAYGMARGMKKPVIITGKIAEDIARWAEKEKTPTYSAKYEGEHVGTVTVQQYNLKRGCTDIITKSNVE